MRIQILTLNLLQKKATFKDEKGNEYLRSPLSAPKTFDAFDINILDLQDEALWRTRLHSTRITDSSDDFLSLKQLITGSKKAINIVCLPFNYVFQSTLMGTTYREQRRLKDMIPDMITIIGNLVPNGITYNLVYENSKTICREKEIDASFYFSNYSAQYKEMTSNIGAGHPTTIQTENNLFLTTLQALRSQESLAAFLSAIGLISNKEPTPDWVQEYPFYNDQDQKDQINTAKNEIEKAERRIKRVKECLEENAFYKRVLYESGTPLVDSVFKMLEKMIKCDLSAFEDKKEEDFRIVLPEITFIGEIKGINSNVQSKHVSQLDVHCETYSDYLEEQSKEESIKGLLIINHQRTKPLNEREEVPQKQIDLAVRNGSLIIPSDVFLRLFEQFLLENITTEQIIKLLIEKTGVLKQSDFPLPSGH